ncbi:hypothetical protein [Arthrobacter sp. TMN-50]
MTAKARAGSSSALVILLLGTVNLAAPGQAQEPERTSWGAPLVVVTDPLEIDARGYVEDYALPVDEAADRLSHHEDLSALLGRISTFAGPRLAGVFLRHEPEFGGVVRLTGEEPLSGLDAVRGDPLWPIVVIEYGAEYSMLELVKAIEDTPWEEISPTIQGVYFDAVTAEIVVDVIGGADDGVTLARALASQPQLRDLPVRINVVGAPLLDSSGIAGILPEGER